MITDNIRLVKFLMNIFPNKPKYQEDHFVQEIFRHPKFTSLSQNEKELTIERLMQNSAIEERRKPFDLFYPSCSFRKMLSGKRVLDLGCGIGSKTIEMGERWEVGEFY